MTELLAYDFRIPATAKGMAKDEAALIELKKRLVDLIGDITQDAEFDCEFDPRRLALKELSDLLEGALADIVTPAIQEYAEVLDQVA